jgi:DNA-binding response OmpR family regulator
MMRRHSADHWTARDPILLVIVDDDELALRLMRRFFQGLGYRVLCAQNGAELRQILRAHACRPDAYIVDLQLPDVSGFELIEEIKAADEDAVIVALSGVFGETQDRAACYRGGAVAFVGKPADSNELVYTIESWVLAKRRNPVWIGRGSVRLRADGMRTLWVAGEEIEIGSKEHALMLRLAKQRGGPVYAEELRRLGQGVADIGSSHAVPVMISTLRKKLGRYAHVLVTVAGGYALRIDYGPLTPDDADERARAAKDHPRVPALRISADELDAGTAEPDRGP